MRVLMLSHMYPSPANVNAGIFVHEQALALRRLGHDVRVVSPRGWAPPGLARWSGQRAIPRRGERDGVQVRYPRRLLLPGGLLGHRTAKMMLLGARRAVAEIHRSWPIDVIHAHTVAPDGWVATRLGAALGVPTVATAHGADVRELPARSPADRAVVADALTGLDAVVAVSRAIADRAEAIATPRRPIAVVHNGASLERFTPGEAAPARAELGLGPEPLVLYVGQLKPLKGSDVLVEAFIRLARRSDARLVCVGVGPARDEMVAAFAAAGVGERVRFCGRVPHDDIARWFAAADVLVLPSRAEGLPTVACEALAAGRPMVATAVGGTPEVVADGETGLLVPSEDAEAIATALAELIADPERRARMGAAARQRAERAFSWEANARAMDEIYRGLAA